MYNLILSNLKVLSLQDYAGFITLGGTSMVIIVAIYLFISTKKGEGRNIVVQKVHKIRARYFLGLVALLSLALFLSLPLVPYPAFKNKADDIVTVAARQWLWILSNGKHKIDNNFTGSQEITVPVNKNIQFNVGSLDVNHGFAIYNSEGVLLAETQVMPGYINKLRYTFKNVGIYKVICLEYCGLGHQVMSATIRVK